MHNAPFRVAIYLPFGAQKDNWMMLCFRVLNFMDMKFNIFSFVANKPMIRKDRVVEYNLLEQLNELVREVSRHKCLHGNRDILRILCLSQSRLYDLIDQLSLVLILFQQHQRP